MRFHKVATSLRKPPSARAVPVAKDGFGNSAGARKTPRRPVPEVRGKLRVALVVDQAVPPVQDGSGLVYKTWIDALAEHCELHVIAFTRAGAQTEAAEDSLASRCERHAIIPAPQGQFALKLVRMAARLITGTLFAPAAIEKLGRRRVQRAVAGFMSGATVDVVIVEKWNSLFL